MEWGRSKPLLTIGQPSNFVREMIVSTGAFKSEI